MASITFRSAANRNDVSTVRLYLMRALYLLNFALIGFSIWPQVINHSTSMPLMEGVALSFYAALSTLSALGLRYPVKMMPLLLLQLFYKSVWLLAFVVPLWSAGALTSDIAGAVQPMVLGVVLDVLVIPWPFVVANYVLAPGDRWKSGPSRGPATAESLPHN
jgi:hypothetical protein